MNRPNDILKNKNFEKIALNYGVPNQINPKAFSKKRKSFAIWKKSFERNNQYNPNYQNQRGNFNRCHINKGFRFLAQRPTELHL